MFSSVGTWKLRVAYIIWLINEDLLWAAGCQFSQHRVEMKIVKKKKRKEEGREAKTKKNENLVFYWPCFDRFCIYVQNLAFKK